MLRAVRPGLDPLVVLAGLSSLGAAVASVGSYPLARRFALERRASLGVVATVAGSHVCLSYGGSGSSYTPAMAMLLLAAVLLVAKREEREWSGRDAAWCNLALVVAWGFWALSALVFPAVYAAGALFSRGSLRRRLSRGVLACAPAAVATAGIVAASYSVWQVGASAPDFLSWLRQSGHGVEVGAGTLGIPRAVYGFVRSFVHLGSIGTSIKGILLGDSSLVRLGETAGVAAIGGTFVILLLLAVIGLSRAARAGAGEARRVGFIALAALIPVAIFASVWQGSDVERFSGCLPFAAVAMILGLETWSVPSERRQPRLGWLLALTVVVGNTLTLIVPTLASGGGLPMQLARAARQSLPPHSVLIVTGGDLGGSVWGPVSYFGGVQVHSLAFDVKQHGVDGWSLRLDAVARGALERGGKVAVLSDLVGQPTPGGIGLSVAEFPRPTLEEVTEHLSDWEQKGRWTVERFTFVEIGPPSQVSY